MKRTADTTRTALRSLSSMGPTVVSLARMQAKRTGKAVVYVTQHGASAVFPNDARIFPYASAVDAQEALSAGGWAGAFEMLEAAQ